ncbi:uncharacterized protein LOC108659215 [Drosophila navojoa]|uniref:uncharacterized protein LOC108659215 n=1 Tax=Drosophila navojoa TaxID=7232 RepID=UPI0011BDC23E|nr:uncharacterized protein LOC108659215 [Drosophila navojoa]
MRHKLYIVGTLQLYLILKLTLNNAAELKFTNAVCTSYNQSWITVQTCNLKAISRNKTGVQTVSGFYMRYEEMRAPVPSGEYLLKVNWLFDKRIQISTNVYFRVQE